MIVASYLRGTLGDAPRVVFILRGTLGDAPRVVFKIKSTDLQECYGNHQDYTNEFFNLVLVKPRSGIG